MKESPCVRCGKMTKHTDDDWDPRCDFCTQVQAADRMLIDILEGRLEVPPLHNEEGEPIE